MIKVSGIDHELSPLEILWAQASEEECGVLAAAFFMKVCDEAGGKVNAKIGTDQADYIITIEKG